MIDARELKIGNLITGLDGTLNVVNCIEYLDNNTSKINGVDCNDFTSISLTTEILLNNNFEEHDIYFCYKPIKNNGIIGKSDLILELNDKAFVPIAYLHIVAPFDQITSIGRPIKYLHQLQNLYFALTGKELGVKL